MKMTKMLLGSGLGLVAASAAEAQSTGAVTVTSVVSTITAQLTPIGLIGVAVLGVVVAIAAYKWVKRAI